MRKPLPRIAAAVAMAAGLILANTGSADAAPAWSWQTGHIYRLESLSPDAGNTCMQDTRESTTYNGHPVDWVRNVPCDLYDTSYRWQVVINANGWANLENVASSNCLDYSQEYGLRGFPCYDTSYTGGWQEWRLVTRQAHGITQVVLQNGRYQEDHANMCADLSLQYGLRGYPCNGTSQDSGYQAWLVFDVAT
ncbi:hypothetical protein [Streptomyces sp. CBMA29]|uniref:hypothetical protein n=1 Tax=Streptomyces sp. CBMA29 TaxID=1896314 RepID=UPI001661F7F7|nr:hypothetical protein [Streptomyces sp. CBMA29]MBD0734920.1 hypothetical protein [Streptomyces sp. CBMA29]